MVVRGRGASLMLLVMVDGAGAAISKAASSRHASQAAAARSSLGGRSPSNGPCVLGLRFHDLVAGNQLFRGAPCWRYLSTWVGIYGWRLIHEPIWPGRCQNNILPHKIHIMIVPHFNHLKL